MMEDITCANVIGDTIYYKSYTDGGKLYKININGTNRTRLSDFRVESVIAFEDYVYFLNEDDSNNLYRISTGGGNAAKLSDEWVWCLDIVSGVIYYGDLDNLYRMNTDGSGGEMLYTSPSYIGIFLYHNGFIYFTTEFTELMRLDIATKSVEHLASADGFPQSLAYINNAIVMTMPSEIFFFKFE